MKWTSVKKLEKLKVTMKNRLENHKRLSRFYTSITKKLTLSESIIEEPKVIDAMEEPHEKDIDPRDNGTN